MPTVLRNSAVALFLIAATFMFFHSRHELEAVHAQTPAYTCAAGSAVTSQLANTGQTCSPFVTAPASIANGGTGTGSTLTGIVRGGATTMTAAEISGDCTTSGSNAINCTKTNGVAFGPGATSTTFPIKATTPSIGGSAISLGCANQTPVTVTGATTSMTCSMSGAGGTQPANVQPQCFVSAANTVTPQFCTSITLGITPTAQTYNLMVY